MSHGLSSSQIELYLDILRINPKAADLNTLNSLIYLHQCTIPFSSVDVFQSETPPSLKVEEVFEKVIVRKRGGYCFELNLLFKELLSSLGFEVYPVLCRVTPPVDERIPIAHRGTLVSLGGKRYFVDVGFGGPTPAGVLELTDSRIQTIMGESFYTQQIDETWWAFDRIKDPGGTLDDIPNKIASQQVFSPPIMEFCTARVENQDFIPFNIWCSQPGSHFNETLICNLRTTTGNYALTNNTLTIRDRGKTEEITYTDQASLHNAINTYFGFHPGS